MQALPKLLQTFFKALREMCEMAGKRYSRKRYRSRNFCSGGRRAPSNVLAYGDRE